MAITSQAAVTPAGIRDGDAAALAALVERRGNAVLAYCEALCPPAVAERAAAEAFARFRAAVAAADDPRALSPDGLLLGATRHAAGAMTPAPGVPPASSGLRGRFGRAATPEVCSHVPELLVARAEGVLGDTDRERLARHLERHAPCRALAAAFERAEHAYATPPSRTVPISALTEIMLALTAAAPITAEPGFDLDFADVVFEDDSRPDSESDVDGPGIAADPAPAAPEEVALVVPPLPSQAESEPSAAAELGEPRPELIAVEPELAAAEREFAEPAPELIAADLSEPKPQLEADPAPAEPKMLLEAEPVPAEPKMLLEAEPVPADPSREEAAPARPEPEPLRAEDAEAATTAMPALVPVASGVALPRPERRHLHLPGGGDHGALYRYVLPGAAVAAALLGAMGVAGFFAGDGDPATRTTGIEVAAPPSGAPPVAPAVDLEARARALKAAQRRAAEDRAVKATAAKRAAAKDRRERKAAAAEDDAPATETTSSAAVLPQQTTATGTTAPSAATPTPKRTAAAPKRTTTTPKGTAAPQKAEKTSPSGSSSALPDTDTAPAPADPGVFEPSAPATP